MAVTLKYVAEMVNLSPVTVSHVLRGRTSTRVSDETRRRIHDAARKLGYRPNPIARSLRTRRTSSLGVITPPWWTNGELIYAIEKRVSQRQYELFLAISGGDPQRQHSEIQRLLYRQVDGLLLTSPAMTKADQQKLEQLVAQGFPVLVIGPEEIAGVNSVDWDRAAAYQIVTEHLLERGCRRLVFLAATATTGVALRERGVRQALAGCADVQLRLIVGDTQGQTERDVVRLAQRLQPMLMAGEVDGVICQTDDQAMAVMQLAATMGVQVPSQLAVVGCSDRSAAALHPVPLTSIRLPDHAMANHAVNRLIGNIESVEPIAHASHQLVPAEVVFRKSSLFGLSS